MAKAMRHRSSRAPRRQTGVTGETLPRIRPGWHRRAEALRYKRLLLWRRPSGLRAAAKPWLTDAGQRQKPTAPGPDRRASFEEEAPLDCRRGASHG